MKLSDIFCQTSLLLPLVDSGVISVDWKARWRSVGCISVLFSRSWTFIHPPSPSTDLVLDTSLCRFFQSNLSDRISPLDNADPLTHIETCLTSSAFMNFRYFANNSTASMYLKAPGDTFLFGGRARRRFGASCTYFPSSSASSSFFHLPIPTQHSPYHHYTTCPSTFVVVCYAAAHGLYAMIVRIGLHARSHWSAHIPLRCRIDVVYVVFITVQILSSRL